RKLLLQLNRNLQRVAPIDLSWHRLTPSLSFSLLQPQEPETGLLKVIHGKIKTGMIAQPPQKSTPGTKPARRRMTAQRRLIAASRRLRELKSIGSALADTAHPYMAHIVPMRRCNLACTYCNEFDDFSKPVGIDEMRRRIGELGRLGTSVITISGGEPLLHPELDDVIRAIRATGAIAGMITNGYLLMPDRIHCLNTAGL